MGVDLTLMPESFNLGGQPYSHHLIEMNRDRVLWSAIETAGIERSVGSVICFKGPREDGEHTYGEATENPYGTPITYVQAGELADLLSKHKVYGANVWIHAALRSMPRALPVYLYWH